EALKAFAELGTVETLWRLIDACATAPNYLQSLWGPGGQRAYELMLEIATKRPLIDVTTFQVVLDDFLRHVPKSFQLDFRKPIKVLQGRCDPYLGSSSRIEPWMGINPAIEVAVVDTGHFPHLELPPERWLAHAALPHSL
ncbi:MAG: hypothetical protein ACRETP_03690, partial [Steroidobacteraceae bacterium]